MPSPSDPGRPRCDRVDRCRNGDIPAWVDFFSLGVESSVPQRQRWSQHSAAKMIVLAICASADRVAVRTE